MFNSNENPSLMQDDKIEASRFDKNNKYISDTSFKEVSVDTSKHRLNESALRKKNKNEISAYEVYHNYNLQEKIDPQNITYLNTDVAEGLAQDLKDTNTFLSMMKTKELAQNQMNLGQQKAVNRILTAIIEGKTKFSENDDIYKLLDLRSDLLKHENKEILLKINNQNTHRNRVDVKIKAHNKVTELEEELSKEDYIKEITDLTLEHLKKKKILEGNNQDEKDLLESINKFRYQNFKKGGLDSTENEPDKDEPKFYYHKKTFSTIVTDHISENGSQNELAVEDEINSTMDQVTSNVDELDNNNQVEALAEEPMPAILDMQNNDVSDTESESQDDLTSQLQAMDEIMPESNTNESKSIEVQQNTSEITNHNDETTSIKTSKESVSEASENDQDESNDSKEISAAEILITKVESLLDEFADTKKEIKRQNLKKKVMPY